jgi:hypothetical protein
MERVLEMLGAGDSKRAQKYSAESEKKDSHKFWSTQPVPDYGAARHRGGGGAPRG